MISYSSEEHWTSMYMNGELGVSEHERDVLVTGNPLSSGVSMTILSVKVKNSRNMYIE